MADPDSLAPPKRVGTADAGTRDVESSDSDDHFSDANSGPASPTPSSPIPRTRVEKVNDEPSYGEVPGTEAYQKREGDAMPDEIAVIPDTTSPPSERSSSSSSSVSFSDSHAVPQTVVVEVPDPSSAPRHSEEFQQRIQETHRADAAPDVVVQVEDAADVTAEDLASPVKSAAGSSAGPASEENDTSTPSPGVKSPEPVNGSSSPQSMDGSFPPDDSPGLESEGESGVDDVGEGGDDFDEFEEGDGEDDDFDDFEDGFQHETPLPAATPQPTMILPLPVPDFDGLDSDDINDTLDPYTHALFPPEEYETPELPPIPNEHPIFLTARSASLWSQLVAPPPLSPPDWIRSRIRRLFLVSLGVPVDLDEILPASKQKKLVLPSLSLRPGSPASHRTSTDSRSVTRLKQGEQNASSTSVDSQGKPSASKRRKGPPPEPEIDLVSAKQVCTTTDEALGGMTDLELRMHVKRLTDLEFQAKDALEHWQKRTDEKISDRETFEGVIENLVKHARKVRK